MPIPDPAIKPKAHVNITIDVENPANINPLPHNVPQRMAQIRGPKRSCSLPPGIDSKANITTPTVYGSETWV